MRINVGLQCIVCQKYKHRKCEKVEAGHIVERYTCRRCTREQDVYEDKSGCDSNDSSSDSESEERSDGCELCQQVRVLEM